MVKKKKISKKKEAPLCCKGCAKWEVFGNKCYVYWVGKRYCTQKVEAISEEE